MTSTKDIYWLAGLLEGEGSFGLRSGLRSPGSQPVLQLGMTDLDVVERARAALGHRASIYTEDPASDGSRRRIKRLYKIVIAGPRAVGWMMTLYPMLGHLFHRIDKRGSTSFDLLSLKSLVILEPTA